LTEVRMYLGRGSPTFPSMELIRRSTRPRRRPRPRRSNRHIEAEAASQGKLAVINNAGGFEFLVCQSCGYSVPGNDKFPKSHKPHLVINAKEHPLCELCLHEGSTTKGTDVHHIHPVSSGGDPFSLQRKLGHRSLEMTRHYCNLVDADVEQPDEGNEQQAGEDNRA
jgi:hypothetical protein